MLSHSYPFLLLFPPLALTGFHPLGKTDGKNACIGWLSLTSLSFHSDLPAYAPSVVDEMRRPPSGYSYLDQIRTALDPLFRKRGLRLSAFTRPEGGTDDEFIGGFHSSQQVTAKMSFEIAEENSAAEIVDSENIRKLLSASTDPRGLVP